MKRRGGDHLDARITQRAIDLFKLARVMIAQGVAHDSQEMNEVALGIHRALNLRPWHDFVIDFECFTLEPPSDPGKADDFAMVKELHRRLVVACERR